MKNIFNMDNKFFTFMTKVADLFILNVLFILCCLPIFTAGASISALYTITLKMAKNEETYIVKKFFKAFKENFKHSTVIWFICIVIMLIFAVDLYYAENLINKNLGYLLKIIFTTFAVIVFIMISYIFPLISKFYNNAINYIKNSFIMAIRHLPLTLPICIINFLPILCFLLGSYFIGYGIYIYLTIGFALGAYLNSFFFNKIFTIYIPKEKILEGES